MLLSYAIAVSILNIFRRRKDSQPKGAILQVSATLYPDKIIIETLDRVKEGFGISSNNITILPVDADVKVLGLTIRYHLNLTKSGLTIPKDQKQHYNDFLRTAGFKNGKEHHRNALLLNISQKGNQIFISPTINGGYTGKDRGFLGVKNAGITVSAGIDDATLGAQVKTGWTKCECKCI